MSSQEPPQRPNRVDTRQRTMTSTSSQPRPQRPDRGNTRQTTTNSLRLNSTLAPTCTAREAPYSLAGHRDVSRQGDRSTYVEEGYHALNPDYEKEIENPNFSLGGNFPHTIRPFMVRKDRGGKQKPVGLKKDEKGETERAPQVENTDARANRTREQRESDPQNNVQQDYDGGEDGEELETVEEGMTPYSSDDTMVPEPAVDAPFNFWAAFRKQYQDPLGEWLGVSLFVNCLCATFSDMKQTTVLTALGIASNLCYATSQNQAETYQSMQLTWGFASMLAIYIAGGSSGAHLNPAVTIMLSVYVSSLGSSFYG